MKILVGNTGLVGTTLKKKVTFDLEFNSKNINLFPETVPDGCELCLCCLPATKWKVNQQLYADIKNISNIIEILSTKNYSNIILISTIDVYNDSPLKVNEDYKPNVGNLSYGNNRYFFELMVRNSLNAESVKVFRLPAVFSSDIKKNILYDLINLNNVNEINVNSVYQWYNLDKLCEDITYFSKEYENETIFNLFTEPIHTKDLLKLFPNLDEHTMVFGKLNVYDYTTKFGGYVSSSDDVLNDIKLLLNELIYK